MTLRSEALDYELPPELIAKEPMLPRDQCRLMVVHTGTGEIEHRRFFELPEYLRPNDCLVVNTTRVRKARLFGQRRTGGRVEALLLRPKTDTTWEALCRPAARLRIGEVVRFDGKATGEIVGVGDEGHRDIRFDTPHPFEEYLNLYGHVPLPPYINRPDRPEDAETYQTVYANTPGAVAAPTAGLHFTDALLSKLSDAGIGRAEIVLHVGPGTFRPLLTETVREHKLDPEWFHVTAATVGQIQRARNAGGRIVAVGTTSVRALETIAINGMQQSEFEGWADLLIAPPHDFKLVDVIITNFHLPRTSLLALVAARAGLDLTLEAYRRAIEDRYRFYSYGDAMLIL